MHTVRIRRDEQSGALILHGGAPSGRDEVHEIVTGWCGWKRTPGRALWNEVPCSVYWAPSWPSSVLPPYHCRVLKIEWSEEARHLADWWTKRLYLKDSVLRHAQTPSLFLPTERRPRQHQVQAIEAIKALEGVALLGDDMGLGKSATALWAAHNMSATRLFIVCPVSVKWNWANEIRETLGSWHCTVVDGSPKTRATQVAEHASYNSSCNGVANLALIINYDLLVGMPEQQLESLYPFLQEAFHIYDESHYLKNKDTERTKLVRDVIAPKAKKILMLTGTPVCNFVNDLYSQIEILRPGTWTSYHNFCDRFLDMRLITHGKKKTMVPARSKKLDALNAIVNTIQIRRMKDECLDLPPKVFTKPELSMSAEMRSVYMAMKDDAKYELEQLIKEHGANVDIWHPAVRTGARNVMMRCEQIAQGFLGGIPDALYERLSKHITKAQAIKGRPGELIFPDFAKMVWLIEAIDAVIVQGGRPVVFSRFNGPLFWLAERYKDSTMLHGGLSGVEKDAAIRNFQDGKVNVFLCQIKMAQGFNLVQSQDCLVFGRDWSPAVNSQAVDRLHRMGQKGTVNVQIPIVRGTIEVFLDKKLAAKESDIDNALASTTLGELVGAL